MRQHRAAGMTFFDWAHYSEQGMMTGTVRIFTNMIPLATLSLFGPGKLCDSKGGLVIAPDTAIRSSTR